jgi:hypothetical protein
MTLRRSRGGEEAYMKERPGVRDMGKRMKQDGKRMNKERPDGNALRRP